MKLLSLACLVFLLYACKTNPKPVSDINTQKADTTKLPKDSLAFYFSGHHFSDIPKVDSFEQNWYSSALYSFKEPILSQQYIGHNIYRFLWLRSFNEPVVFTIHQAHGLVWLNTKMLSQQPQFYDMSMGGVPKNEQAEYLRKGYVADPKVPNFFIKKADRKANIIYDKTTPLSEDEWNQFKQLLEKANYWSLPTKVDDGSTDGAQWIIEAHFQDKYKVVDSHSPVGDYKAAGVFLINLSKLKEEIY